MFPQRTLADIHAYWFEGIDDATVIVKKRPPFVKWFRSTRQLDEEMRENFVHLFAESSDSILPEPDGRLALCRVLLYDQLARNIFRRTPRAYAYDTLARKLSRDLIDGNRHEAFMLIERSFVYMPLTHSEEQEDQALSVHLTEALLAEATRRGAPNIAYFESNLAYARTYQEIIMRFGRFPHRNRILERLSTPEEEEFLCRK